jgi:hypothetical protein
LQLAGNRVGVEGARALAGLVQCSPPLVHLGVGQNELCDPAVEALLRVCCYSVAEDPPFPCGGGGSGDGLCGSGSGTGALEALDASGNAYCAESRLVLLHAMAGGAGAQGERGGLKEAAGCRRRLLWLH